MNIHSLINYLVSLGLVFFLSSCSLNLVKQSWNLESIEEILGVSIPSDARNISYEGHPARGGYLDLRFDASSHNALKFAERFCDGQILRGFDPFNSVIVDRSTPNSHEIDMGYFIYYALSKDTVNTLHGIRCPFFRLSIDQSRQDIYSIHLLYEFHHHDPAEVPVEFTGTPFWEFTD